VDLTNRVDAARVEASAALNRRTREDLGQFLTPADIARLMAKMISHTPRVVRILEPGAGVGSLVAACVEELCARDDAPARIEVTAYELDPMLLAHLRDTMQACETHCRAAGIAFHANVVEGDFLELVCGAILREVSGASMPSAYDVVITNPPYRKINSGSRHRKLTRAAGLETTNLYTAFAGVALQLLVPGGEIIAITPRSFANGRYFRPFRELLLGQTSIRQVHVFGSRRYAFREDAVLQENIIWRAIRGASSDQVLITSSKEHPGASSRREIPADQLVWPEDPEKFIHIAPDSGAQAITDLMQSLPSTLAKLGLTVSTGRVVDFRADGQLRQYSSPGTVPLLYPIHVHHGYARWPLDGKKPNALHVDAHTCGLIVPEGVYVLVKRFSPKEGRRRIIAAMYDPAKLPSPNGIAFENHLNYIHQNGAGLDREIAAGLVMYLNTTFADQAFRQFSGHTQVNAGDLRRMAFPCAEDLRALGASLGDTLPEQEQIDAALTRILVRSCIPPLFEHCDSTCRGYSRGKNSLLEAIVEDFDDARTRGSTRVVPWTADSTARSRTAESASQL
jgi:adenine-specific DNA-methyltransferase